MSKDPTNSNPSPNFDWSLIKSTSNSNMISSIQPIPIILKYTIHSLVTIKHLNLIDCLNEAASEFNLNPLEIFLTISINKNLIKISNSLFNQLGPLSTIYVELNQKENLNLFSSLLIDSNLIKSSNISSVSCSNSNSITNSSSSTSIRSNSSNSLNSNLSNQIINHNHNPIIDLESLKSNNNSSQSNQTINPLNQNQKRFLINSLANSNQPRQKFPFLSNRHSDHSNLSISSSSSSSPPSFIQSNNLQTHDDHSSIEETSQHTLNSP
ncbi:hypothetical protein O181_069962 [Austropuccinia psidii MF-1]|uniref:Uncharacterized protein n=1 Tax=Austropuccinia psidii MF-1 TaxID=1389203 RepID=A0A9Q3I7T1_9BASI|nr:hypothetical protein [Austropuccinia psidii MF-1]